MPRADPRSPQRLLAMAEGFRASRVLLTGQELGVFDALGEERRSSAEIAAKLGTDPRATERLLNALVALDVLAKRDGLFRNGPEAAAFLVSGKPDHLGGLGHTLRLWHSWSTLTQAVRTGTCVPTAERRGEADPGRTESFIAAMHWRAKEQARRLSALLDLEGVRQILDVGGGSGAFAIELVRDREGARATVLDLPDVVPIARRRIREAGLEGRMDTLAADLTKDNLPGGNDLVLVSAILHMLPPQGCRDLLGRCARSLNPGGRLAVREFLLEEDRTSPPSGALFALNMLVNTEAGDAYTAGEILAWMEAAGLGEIEINREADLVVGRKP